MTASLRNFSNVVQDIDVLLSGCEPGPEQRAKLQSVRDDSTSLLNDLLKQIEKDGAIEAPSTSMTRGVKKAWKRFNWDQNDVQDFRSRISVNLALLNAIEGNLSRYFAKILFNFSSAKTSTVKDPPEFNRTFTTSPSDRTNSGDMKSSSGLEALITAHVKARYLTSVKRELANGFYPLTNSGNGSKRSKRSCSVQAFPERGRPS